MNNITYKQKIRSGVNNNRRWIPAQSNFEKFDTAQAPKKNKN